MSHLLAKNVGLSAAKEGSIQRRGPVGLSCRTEARDPGSDPSWRVRANEFYSVWGDRSQ